MECRKKRLKGAISVEKLSIAKTENSLESVPLNFNRLRDFNNGSECDMGNENAIILGTRFCKVVTGFKWAGYVKPHT